MNPREPAPPGAAPAYEQVAYPGYVYPQTHPARLEVLGRFFGLDPVPAAHGTILELGCGDGGNALAIAQTLPEARVVGVDSSESAIARGRALANAAGLTNLELRLTDLSAPTAVQDLAPVDYVIAHGVYSWIPPAARTALLQCCGRFLAPAGIAYVSYNAYPGSYLRDMARDVLDYHLRGVTEPDRRLASAHELMQAIVSAQTPTPYARVLREHMERMLAAGEALLFHDDLAPVSTPVYFHEFVEHAAAHGLQFLSEAELSDSRLVEVPESAAELIQNLPQDVIVREQYLDFFTNRMFRQTLLARAEVSLTRAIDGAQLEHTVISSPATGDGDTFSAPNGSSLSTSDPLVQAAMRALSELWPVAVPFPELVQRASESVETRPVAADKLAQLGQAMFDAWLVGAVKLDACDLGAVGPDVPRPCASPLARAQNAGGLPLLSTLLPGNVSLDGELERRLLGLLDGSRDRSQLAIELGLEAETLDGALEHLAMSGLLCDARLGGS
ncbi:MAG: class I SAM-dependent methyltransferase [Solirubrobacteraceae bacterium]